MIDESWWRNAPSFATSLPSSWISPFLLCDLGQATSPLWNSFPICKMRMMGAQTSSSSCEDEIISFYVMCLQQWPTHGNFLHVRSACMLSRVWTARLLCPWDSPGKNTGVGCHFLLQGYSQPKIRTWVSCIVGRFFTVWATRETQDPKSCVAKKQGRSSCPEQNHNWTHAQDDWHHLSFFIVSFSFKLTWIHWNQKVKQKKRLPGKNKIKLLPGENEALMLFP